MTAKDIPDDGDEDDVRGFDKQMFGSIIEQHLPGADLVWKLMSSMFDHYILYLIFSSIMNFNASTTITTNDIKPAY